VSSSAATVCFLSFRLSKKRPSKDCALAFASKASAISFEGILPCRNRKSVPFGRVNQESTR
jgi:hypothetical protein